MEQYIIREGLKIDEAPLVRPPHYEESLGGVKAGDETWRTVRDNVAILEEALGIKIKKRYTWGAKQLAGAKLTRREK